MTLGLIVLGIVLGVGYLLVLACSELMDGLMGDDE